jgi:hypothetical protein
MFLLMGLTWFVAKNRKANVWVEMLKHLAVAAIVIMVSRVTGMLIAAYLE